jgi:plasmid stabilization system protein ParE
MSGQYSNPIRVIAFNTAERWSEDVSEDVASEIRRRCDLQICDVPSAIQNFVETHEGGRRQLTLRLV